MISVNEPSVWIKLKRLRWQSDWNGYEVGFEDVEVVGLYQLEDTEIMMYINAETGEILEILE